MSDGMAQRPRIVIAGTHSGVGKTTVTVAILAALQKRGLCVQGFKVGPDYIDPSYHTAVTGRPARNLDGWMLGSDVLLEVFLRGSEGADIAIIEGVMGFLDGKDPLGHAGSTAEMSEWLHAPTILVLDVSGMARSAAAIVTGFQSHFSGRSIAGVIANRTGGQGHFHIVKTAIEQACGVPVLGHFPRNDAMTIPERHLGLVPAIERGELHSMFGALAEAAESGLDMDRLVDIATGAQPLGWPQKRVFVTKTEPPLARIAVARDAAFNFYYPENLELLACYGADLVNFSPLAGESVPAEVDGLYIGGGFPEEFAAQLSGHHHVLADVRTRIVDGLPTFAECGGFMFLSKVLVDKHGSAHRMAGVIPGTVQMMDHVVALGYREVTALQDCVLLQKGAMAKGHEFHYSTFTASMTMANSNGMAPAFGVHDRRFVQEEGWATGSLLAGYTHLHFASNPDMARRFVSACAAYRNRRKGAGAGD